MLLRSNKAPYAAQSVSMATDIVRVGRALLSVSDKAGLVDLARGGHISLGLPGRLPASWGKRASRIVGFQE